MRGIDIELDEEAIRNEKKKQKKNNDSRAIELTQIPPIRESHGRVPDSSRNLTYPVARVPTLAFPLTEARPKKSFRFRAAVQYREGGY